jgi:hypothetical protein
MITDMIYEYLKARCEILNEDFDIDQVNDLEVPFAEGFRSLHGIQVNEKCFLLWDDKLPNEHRGVLNAFINCYITKHYTLINESLNNLN